MSKYIPRKSLPENIAIPKGATEALKVDKDEIERMLIALRKNSEILVSQTDKTLSLYIRTIRDHALKFHNTSSYSDFYKLILKHFSDVGILLPNTISSFLIGRGLYKGDFSNKSYAPTCVGSIPSIDDNIIESDKNITIVYRDLASGKSIASSIFKAKQSKADIVVLMGDLDNINAPLAESELNLLKSLNLYKYELYTYFNGYYKTQRTLQMVSPTKKPLVYHNSTRGRKMAFIFIDLLFVILLLIVLFILLAKHR